MSRQDITPQIDPSTTDRYIYNPPDLSELELSVSKALAAAHARKLGGSPAPSARSAEARGDAPPQVTRGESTQTLKLVCDDGVIKEVPQRRGWGGTAAFVDWVNFTCHESSFYWDLEAVTDDQVIAEVSKTCLHIFGFGITRVRENGANFYQRSYEMADRDGQKFGLICHGGQRNTVLVSISGEGCAAALDGWEIRLFEFLNGRASNARITRVDLAYDDYHGEDVSVDCLETVYDLGLFNCGGRNPDIEQRGNWKNPNGKGRTLYVGNRTNGKFFRGYEKGKQLGDKSSAWVRLETEFKSVDRVIPFDILLRAGEYLAAAYPALAWISERQERILTVQKTVEASYERTKNWLKSQCGSAINLMLQVEQNAETVLALIIREGKLPRGLTVPDSRNCGEFIHEFKREQLSTAAFADMSFST
jgi:phage replication initiation protein